jgi:hypothetical protein
MSRVTITADGIDYLTSPDAPPRRALWTVATARIVDELTSGIPNAVVSLSVEEPGLALVLGEDSRFGLVTQPQDRFPIPTAPFAAHVWIRADRYLPRRVTVPIVRQVAVAVLAGAFVVTLDSTLGIRPGQQWVIGPPGSSEPVTIAALGPGPADVTLVGALASNHGLSEPFAPDALTMIDLGDIPLHRAAVVFKGRVMEFVTATHTWRPVTPPAAVDITHVWRRQADVTNDALKEAIRMVAIAPGLYSDRASAVDTLQPIAITPVAGDNKTLESPVRPDTDGFRVSNALGIALGLLLRVDIDHPDVAETVELATVTPDGTAVEPAAVTVLPALVRDHRGGVTVEHVTTANVLVPKALQTDGLAGDPVVFLADLAWAGTPVTARIAGGAPDEVQMVALFKTTTDADGYFTFPPMSRVAKVRIVVTAPPHAPKEIDVQPYYRSVDQWVGVSLT